MAEATGAKEPQGKQEIVRLGQRFQLFSPEKSDTLLDLPVLTSPIPIMSVFDNFESESIGNATVYFVSHSFIPFDPKLGYQVTNEDLDAVKRLRKLDEAYNVYNKDTKIKERLFLFSLKSLPNSLFLREEDIAVLRNLRVQLFFPYGSYEAQVRGDPLRQGKLSFDYFYPGDTGPLPQLDKDDLIPGNIYPHKGLSLLLPKDMTKLSKIEARFVLAPEEVQDAEINSA